MERSLLIVDDEKDVRTFLASVLENEGFETACAKDGKEAIAMMKIVSYGLALVDMNMPELDGFEVLKASKSIDHAPAIIIMTGFGSIESAVKSIKLGALDYITKPFSLFEVKTKVKRYFDQMKIYQERMAFEEKNIVLEEQIKELSGFERFVGEDHKILKIKELVNVLASAPTSVLIFGESGTGKEMVARAIHGAGNRRDRAFVKVNCSSLAPTLLESELFGHEKGAFTGAVASKKGRFEIADKGTVFLDEIGDIPNEIQVKLLRFLDDKEFEKVGGEKTLKMDVRIIAATNRNLKALVAAGSFRGDLFHRLNVVSFELPPLRDRKFDIPVLTEFFIKQFNKELEKNISGLTEEVKLLLYGYDWPGNVRELRNVVERAVLLTKGAVIESEFLPSEFMLDNAEASLRAIAAHPAGKCASAKVRELSRMDVEKALQESNGWKELAAKKLGISRTTMWRKMKELGISGLGRTP